MTAGRPDLWTPDRDAKLELMARAGYSASQIATEIGCTKNAVIGRARRLFGSLGALAPRQKPRDRHDIGVARKKKRREPVTVHPSHVPVSATLSVTGCRWIEHNAYCDQPVDTNARFKFCPSHMERAFK